MITTDYLSTVYDIEKFQKIVDECLRAAETMRKTIPFDAIAFTGTSGAAMAYILSNMMSVPLICVRKPSESSHYMASGRGMVEGYVAAKRYIIVDDFICSGSTIRGIHAAVSAKIPDSELVGIVLYAKLAGESAPFNIRATLESWVDIPVVGCRPEEIRS